MDVAVGDEKLGYEEQAMAFALQGLANRQDKEEEERRGSSSSSNRNGGGGSDGGGARPRLMVKAGFLNFDWPDSDSYWRGVLEASGRVTFTNFTSTLCGLVDGLTSAASSSSDTIMATATTTFRTTTTSSSTTTTTTAAADDDILNHNNNNNNDMIIKPVEIKGAVLYDGAHPNPYGHAFGMAMTLAGTEVLLPMTTDMRAKHTCLQRFKVVRDLRAEHAPQMRNRTTAWQWAISELLPQTNASIMYNVFRDTVHYLDDAQSHATLASADYAVLYGGFVTDLVPSDANDDALLRQALVQHMEPLYDAFGWAHDEHSWTRTVCTTGGTVFCSFAAPNLSFWAVLALPSSSPSPGRARPLPDSDSKRALDPSKYYVTFETNEGDTPRIVDAAFGASWASPRRGSMPVAWAVDPALAERFPALWDYYASTASANDSFVGGVAGAGYVYLGSLTAAQLERYGQRVGRLYAEFGPHVADTYGQANLSTISAYYAAALRGGGGRANDDVLRAFVAQPLWSHGKYAQDAWRCPELNLYLPGHGTPIICTANDPNLFYRNRGLSKDHPGADLAARIKSVAARYQPPFFITVYGGLSWQPGTATGKLEFWSLLHATMDALGDDFLAVGASEMARLAQAACNKTAPLPPPSCAVTLEQNDCSPVPGQPWKNSSQKECLALGCCWHQGGIPPSGHYCVKKEQPAPTCLRHRPK